jgi:hypothetical protein
MPFPARLGRSDSLSAAGQSGGHSQYSSQRWERSWGHARKSFTPVTPECQSWFMAKMKLPDTAGLVKLAGATYNHATTYYATASGMLTEAHRWRSRPPCSDSRNS